MILYYAMGGGLGHLTRARAVVQTLNAEIPVTLMTSSEFVDDRRVVGDFEVVEVPRSLERDLPGYKLWLADRLNQLSPSEIYLDTFPAGILGEFCDFSFPPEASIYCIARLLRWSEYRKQLTGAGPVFEATYLLEPLTPDHHSYLEAVSSMVLPLELNDVRFDCEEIEQETDSYSREPDGLKRPLWLVVHSGPESEINELLAYANEMSSAESVEAEILLIAPRVRGMNSSGIRETDCSSHGREVNFLSRFREMNSSSAPLREMGSSGVRDMNCSPGIRETNCSSNGREMDFSSRLREMNSSSTPLREMGGSSEDREMNCSSIKRFDVYPASRLFQQADRIITGCGFNIMRETESMRDKHHFLPFPRRFDDQFLRANRRRNAQQEAAVRY